MYTAFLEGLGRLGRALDEAVKIGGNDGADNLPEPYLAGRVEVRLDGEVVGWFQIEDEWVTYVPKAGAGS
jgi:hypothetical protein